VLPAESRMRRSAEFELAVRRGSRAGRALLTGYMLVCGDRAAQAPLVGFVVSKAVGNAVVRNKVRRRLRSVMRGYLPALPGGSLVVVRAHPQAAAARQADLAAELDLVMGRLMRRQVGVLR
jgi:ribonuclease P protein component